MAILNVTPDSFSDGNELAGTSQAVKRARSHLNNGADIIDVGGESSRPGARPVSIDEELERVIPVVEILAGEGVRVSVDTRHAPVMAAAISAGAAIINDISALSNDAKSLDVIAASKVSVVLMHMQGDPQSMQDAPAYDDVVAEVGAWLVTRIRVCEKAGISRDRIAIDPGIGFGKTLQHNLDLLRNLNAFSGLGCPVVVGASRKSFIGQLDGTASEPEQRLAGSLAAGLAGVSRGASILRVHDVAKTRQALAVWQALNIT